MQLSNIKLSDIATPSYVRTQNGHDKGSISELAASIKAMGLLQNIVVRAATETDPDQESENGEKRPYIVIAGRRRIAAMRQLGWDEAPALVMDVESAGSYEAEIAENIQREQMTLADTARAVRTLMAIYNNAKKVGEALNKSQAWVSKHLAVTSSKCPAEVRELLDQGLVEDLETLVLLKQIGEMRSVEANAQFARLVKIGGQGNLNRQLARDSLAKLKDPMPTPQAPVTKRLLTTGATVQEQDLGKDETPRTHFAVSLPIEVLEKLERLGGADWITRQITEAAEPGQPDPQAN